MPVPNPVTRSRIVEGRVVANQPLTERLYSLHVELPLEPFEAGQFVRLQLDVGGETLARPYSLVNPPDDPVAEIFFNTVPSGVLSNALANLRAGDAVGVSQPASGFFTLDEAPAARDLWMIATGTGLGPYLSMLRTPKVWERFERIVLVHGVRVCRELVYREVIENILRTHRDRFTQLGCVSREECPAGLEGRVTEAIGSGRLENRVGFSITPADSSVMLCGNHDMINDVRGLLAERGMRKHLRRKPGHILTEEYY